MRNRMTSRTGARSLRAEIADVERLISAADDAELESEAAAIADEEAAAVSESVDEPVSEDLAGQNEKANDNWPIEARQKVAARLVDMAKRLIG